MLILDSNVWIYILTAEEFPVEIYSDVLGERLNVTEDFYEGRRKTVLSAYMIEEIRQGLDRSTRVDGPEIDEALTKFFTLIQRCDDILTPFDGDELRSVDLSEVRKRSSMQLLSHVLGIQAKDVPIFLVAYQYRYDKPHILTDDGGFGELSPATFDLPNITIEELSLTW